MAVIDILIGLALLYGLIRGMWKGLFAELAALLSLALGLYAAIKFSGYMGNWLNGVFGWEDKYIKIAAFILTFAIVVVVVTVMGRVFTKMAGLVMMGWLNRLLGGLFGLIKWALIVSVLLNFFMQMNSSNAFADETTLQKSVFFYPVLKVSRTLYPVLEEWVADFKDAAAKPADTQEEPTDEEPIEGLDRSV